MTKPQLLKICEQYGQVDVITLKTKIDDDEIISRGIAIVQFTSKEGAANALRNLPFEEKLGDQSRISL